MTNSLLSTLSGSFQVAPTFWLNPNNRVSYPIVVQTPQYRVDTINKIMGQILEDMTKTSRERIEKYQKNPDEVEAVEQLPVVLRLGLAPWLVEFLPDRLSLARIAHIGVVGYLVVIVMKTEPSKLSSSTRRLS